MTYRGHIKDGQVALDEPAKLPEGAAVSVELLHEQVDYNGVRVTRPRNRKPLPRIQPVEWPGPSLADELVRDRR